MIATQNEYVGADVGELAKQQEYKRNLQNARTQQKAQYEQKLASNIKGSHSNVQPKTDAQTKQALQQKQKKNFLAQTAKSGKKNAKTKTHQQDIKRYERTPWALMYVAAAANVLGGFGVVFFGLGYLLVIPATIFIDIMVWQAVGGSERIAIRTAVVAVTAIKIFISPLPAGLVLVILTQVVAKMKERAAKEEIEKIEKKMSK